MKIINSILFGIGYYNPAYDGLMEVRDISIKLLPFEKKELVLYCYGSSLTIGSLITVLASLDSTINNSSVKVSFNKDLDRKFWKKSDSIFTTKDIMEFRVNIVNKTYSEIDSILNLNVSLKLPEELDYISNYTVQKSKYYIIKEPIQLEFIGSLIINPSPNEGYRFLSYSGGGTLVLLDNSTGIPVTENIPKVFNKINSVKLDAGYLKYDDDTLVDWDSDGLTTNIQSKNIADDSGDDYLYDDGSNINQSDSNIIPATIIKKEDK